MNVSEQLSYQAQFKPGKQLIKVYKVVQNGDKVSKMELFVGYLADVSDRGLFLVPMGEHGESIDKLSASFLAFPQYRNDATYEYRVFKEI